MPFVMTGTLAREAVGVRIEFLARSQGIRENALARLNTTEDPLTIAQSLTDGVTTVDVFGDEKAAFALKLDTLLGAGQGQAYITQVDGLDADKQDTTSNRQHVREYWQDKQAAIPGLTQQIRQAFVQALGAGAIQLRWGHPEVTGTTAGSAAYTAEAGVVMTIEPPTPAA